MDGRAEALAQALEEIGDNAVDLLQIHRYVSGWRWEDESPGPGCRTAVKEFRWSRGSDRGSVRAAVRVDFQGLIQIEVREV